MTGIIKLKAKITDFSVWDYTIHLYVKQFHQQHNVYPNILLANDFTYSKINIRVQLHPERLIDYEGKNAKKSDITFRGIGSFDAFNYSLHFCTDNKLADDMFMLVFDASPDFDGEPIPEEIEENEENQYVYKKCA